MNDLGVEPVSSHQRFLATIHLSLGLYPLMKSEILVS